MSWNRFCGWFLLLLVAGCRVGPRYEPPNPVLPADWKNPHIEESETTYLDHWWEIFDDETLNALEMKAIENNPDLYTALQKVFEARAITGIEAAPLYPQLNLNPSYTNMMFLQKLYLPNNVSIPGLTSISPFRIHELIYTLPLNLSYEIDLFGKLHDQYDSAKFNAEAQEQGYLSALLTLTADVANTYFQLRAFDSQIDLLTKNIETRNKNLKLTESRFKKGVVTFLDVTQAQVDLANVQTSYEDAIRMRELTENQLAVLTGQFATEFCIDHNPLEKSPPTIPPGIPSTILLQRPDIAAAERTMASTGALINAAYASFFPSFTLTSALGYLSPDISQFLKWISRYWQIGANASQMVFDGGHDCYTLQSAWATFLEASGSYQAQVLTAVKEVEDALNNIEQQKKEEKFLRNATAASQKATEISLKRYSGGVAIYLEVVENERLELQAEVNLVNLQGMLYTSTIQLIKALGGSWGNLLKPPSEEPCCKAQGETSDESHLPRICPNDLCRNPL